VAGLRAQRDAAAAAAADRAQQQQADAEAVAGGVGEPVGGGREGGIAAGRDQGAGLLPTPAAPEHRVARQSSGDAFSSTLFSSFSADMHRMTELKKSVPGFFIVVNGHAHDCGSVDVKESPHFSASNPTVRSIEKGTVVFADSFTSVSEHGLGLSSQVWLHIPDGWVPTSWEVAAGVHLALLRAYKEDGSVTPDPVDMTALLMQSAAAAKASSRRNHSSRSAENTHSRRDSPSPPATGAAGYPPRSSSSRSSPSRSQSHSHKKSSSSSSSATNAAISDAILQARQDISELTRSLREASSDHSRASTRHHVSRSMRIPSHFRTPERRTAHQSASPVSGLSSSSVRVERLIAMQQQIDGLSSSILDIQDALSLVRSGLVDALTGQPPT
jgi:hypothetical protein